MFKLKLLATCLMSATVFSNVALAQTNDEKLPVVSDADILTIEAKKEALLYMLMERGELEPLLDELKEKDRKARAKNDLTKAYPQTPDEIIKRRTLDDKYQRAINAPVKNKRVEISEEDYSLDGVTPIFLNVSSNNPSSLAFFDYQGNPWPIVGDVIGDGAAFKSFPFGEAKNTAVFQIQQKFSETVALINLQGVNQLVVVKLVGNEDSFDARKNIRLPLRGPLSDDVVVSTGNHVSPSDPVLIQMLNGERVQGGKHYIADWDDHSIFVRVGNLLYVRTRDEVTFPPNLNNQKSANGYNLYKLEFSNTLTMKKDGQYEILTLEAVKEIR